jgi:hypothetical protein
VRFLFKLVPLLFGDAAFIVFLFRVRLGQYLSPTLNESRSSTFRILRVLGFPFVPKSDRQHPAVRDRHRCKPALNGRQRRQQSVRTCFPSEFFVSLVFLLFQNETNNIPLFETAVGANQP